MSAITLKNQDNKTNAQGESVKDLYPPPEDFYRSKVKVKHESVNYGLNMYFKKNHKWSDAPDQAGGDLAPN